MWWIAGTVRYNPPIVLQTRDRYSHPSPPGHYRSWRCRWGPGVLIVLSTGKYPHVL
ncbi:hypothetical protein BD309DRAFT_945331 [Dichomitus squalens]|nr:hypothetical protein BD309DRAFT_945331 [Dichomitus squalens]